MDNGEGKMIVEQSVESWTKSDLESGAFHVVFVVQRAHILCLCLAGLHR